MHQALLHTSDEDTFDCGKYDEIQEMQLRERIVSDLFKLGAKSQLLSINHAGRAFCFYLHPLIPTWSLIHFTDGTDCQVLRQDEQRAQVEAQPRAAAEAQRVQGGPSG